MNDKATSPYQEASEQLKLSLQEQNLYLHHLRNLYGDGKVLTPGGDIMTLFQTVIGGPGGKYYSVPTIWDGAALSIPEVQQRVQQQGYDNFPSYRTPEEAQLRYDAMHDYMDKDTAAYLATHGQNQ